MGKIIIFEETTKNPITKIGERAGYCWGADTSDPLKNYKRGMSCIKSGHGRALEFVNCEFALEGFSARVIREWYTHIGGAPTRLQASTRYINYGDNPDFVTPPSVEAAGQEAVDLYQNGMKNAFKVAAQLEDMGVPREDSALLLPMGMTTKIVDKRNVRNLIDMSRQRMCTRAYHEYRTMFIQLISELERYSDEWNTLINMTMHPKCEELGYCPEEKSCGRMPKSKHNA